MCGCPKHQDENAACDCLCDAHRNFEAARDLAMRRYDVIVALEAERDEFDRRAEVAEAQLAGIREVLADEWLNGRILPAALGAPDQARMRAIEQIITGNPSGA